MKRCSGCKEEKAFSEFNKKASRKDGLQGFCRDCNSKAAQKYYQANKSKASANARLQNKKQKQVNREFLLAYLREHPCVEPDCRNADIRVLDFDHTGEVPKIANINKLLQGASLKKLIEEVAKCEVRCRNCHAIKTFERAGNVDWRSKGFLEMFE